MLTNFNSFVTFSTTMKLLWILGLIGFTTAVWEPHPDCGVSDVEDAGAERPSDHFRRNGRIVGGWEVVPHEYPWVVTVGWATGSFFCGGAIIDEWRVLTAAHCTEDTEASLMRVGVGEHYLMSGSEFENKVIALVREHPQYGGSWSLENDVAVIELKEEITLNHAKRPLCPSTHTGNADGYDGERLIVAGWGTTSEGGQTSDHLRAVDLVGMTYQDCKTHGTFPQPWIKEGMMCAMYQPGGKDSCQGDSGGPLVFHRADGKFESVGIVSWGEGCARPDTPGVYADAVYYKDWI